jgi:hypothetical protein
MRADAFTRSQGMEFGNPENVIALALTLIGIAWALSFWIKPEKYNPNSVLHRQIYLWYVGWFGKTLDESYQLERDEVRKAGVAMTLIGTVAFILALLAATL